MRTAPKRVMMGRDHLVRVEVSAPSEWPEGEVEVVVDLYRAANAPQIPNRISSVYGKGRNRTWMADDFDAPLEDFAEYM